MAITNFSSRIPPKINFSSYVGDEFHRVQLTLDSLIFLLKILETPIEIGPPDSAGVGFRALRIPN